MEVLGNGFLPFPPLVRTLVSTRSQIDLVDKVTCSVDSFSPEISSPNLAMYHGSSHLLNCTILSFSYAILLRSDRCSELLHNVILITEFREFGIFKLLPMVTFDSLDAVSLLNLNQSALAYSKASDFPRSNMTHVNMEKSSAITIIYLFPPLLSFLDWLIKSIWSSSRVLYVWIDFFFLYLPQFWQPHNELIFFCLGQIFEIQMPHTLVPYLYFIQPFSITSHRGTWLHPIVVV